MPQNIIDELALSLNIISRDLTLTDEERFDKFQKEISSAIARTRQELIDEILCEFPENKDELTEDCEQNMGFNDGLNVCKNIIKSLK